MAPIDSIERFYAHAIALEREAAERYAEFAVHFADRGEEVLAGLCGNPPRWSATSPERLLEIALHAEMCAFDRALEGLDARQREPAGHP